MSITFATAFADCAAVLKAYQSLNAFAGAQAQMKAYVFTVTAVSTAPVVGATYTNNGITYTVISTVSAAGVTVAMVGSGIPLASGTLTKAAGTGDATLTFSAFTAYSNWLEVTVSAISTAPTTGATYTNNGFTYTVLATMSAAGTSLALAGNGVPTPSGTLTKASGTGDATITITAITAAANWFGASAAQLSYVGGPVVNQGEMVNSILARLEGAGLTSLIPFNNWQTTISTIDSSLQSQKSALAGLLQQVIITRVNNDVPQQNPSSFQQAMTEWIRQMQIVPTTVQQATLSATVTAGSNNTGSAVTGPAVVMTFYDANGLLLEYSFAETMILECTQDQFSGATAGSEQISVVGAAAQSPLSYLWPAGSGFAGSVVMIDPTQGNGSGQNLITGSTSASNVGAFKAFTSSIPNAWLINAGGALISDGTSSNYSGAAHCLLVTGDGATQFDLYQNFANGSITTGSNQTLLPNTVYQFACRIKTATVPAAGNILISLTDGSLNVINNNQGTANTISFTLSGTGNTTWQTISGTFQTPTIMPTNCRLRIYSTTALTSTRTLLVDFPALTQPPTQAYGGLYAGGPFLSMFRGSTDISRFISYTIGDFWKVVVANNYSSKSLQPLSFGVLMNQLLGLAQLGLIQPSAATPVISDALLGQ